MNDDYLNNVIADYADAVADIQRRLDDDAREIQGLRAELAQAEKERDAAAASAQDYDKDCIDMRYQRDHWERIAAQVPELNAQLLRADALQDLAYANGAHFALVASAGGLSDEKIMDRASRGRHEALCILKDSREMVAQRDADPDVAAKEIQDRNEDVAIAINRALRAEALLREAAEALERFADASEQLDPDHKDNYGIWEAPCAIEIDAGDLRLARAVREKIIRRLGE